MTEAKAKAEAKQPETEKD